MFFRIIKSFIFIIISVAILGGGFFAGIYSRDYYKAWQDRRDLRNLVSTYEQAQKDEEARKMADTYGGKTPQETLQMFIDAVEKGDYELASKYFVESKREKWKSQMNKFTSDDRDWFLNKMLIENDGSYHGVDNEIYIMKSFANYEKYSLYSLINFIFYPNKVWKISNIEPVDF